MTDFGGRHVPVSVIAMGGIRSITTPERDYRFRATSAVDDWATALSRMAMNISYTNYKDEILRTEGLWRERVYERVWSVMRHAQDCVDAPAKR